MRPDVCRNRNKTLSPGNGPGYLRADLQASLRRKSLDPDDLSAFQRILLTTDGMVTEMLEAYLGERMVVTRLGQAVDPAAAPANLHLDENDVVWRRAILLRGEQSGTTCIYADSVIVANRLPDELRDGLEQTRKPIGQLLLESRLESYREILSVDLEPAGQLAEHFAIDSDARLLTRTYLVYAEHRPIMQITEKFPQSSFLL